MIGAGLEAVAEVLVSFSQAQFAVQLFVSARFLAELLFFELKYYKLELGNHALFLMLCF